MKKNIPNYKRDKYIFISNLSEVTANKLYDLTFKRDGYLLSEYYTNAKSIDLAKYVKKRRNLLISDNGNFSRMKKIAKKFEKKGNAILNKAINEVDDYGKIDDSTLNERSDLIKSIYDTCSSVSKTIDSNKIIEKQLLINPDYIIGLEDYNITVIMMCGLLHPVFKPEHFEIKKHQLASVNLFNKQVKGDYGYNEQLKEVNNYLVLHSYDYKSAYQAAEVAKKSSADGYAISFGGPMKSRRWITSLNIGEETLQFQEKLPEAYLIAAAISKGTNDAMRNDLPLHILGVGTPILVALIGCLFNKSRAISIDSTAPFKDAYAGKIYGSKHAFIKMDMNKVAAYQLRNNTPYTSITPFFKEFESQFPSNWTAIRKELNITSESEIKNIINDLKQNQELVEKYIPFFTKLRAGNDELIEKLRISRSGHNFWILNNICKSIRIRMDDDLKLQKWAKYQVDRYSKVGSRKWVIAIKKCYELSKVL